MCNESSSRLIQKFSTINFQSPSAVVASFPIENKRRVMLFTYRPHCTTPYCDNIIIRRLEIRYTILKYYYSVLCIPYIRRCMEVTVKIYYWRRKKYYFFCWFIIFVVITIKNIKREKVDHADFTHIIVTALIMSEILWCIQIRHILIYSFVYHYNV